jgi:CarD family transcriptional regulator
MPYFKIGDTIIYPNQGLGIIEDIQDENHFGENFKVFHFRILSNDTLVLVPSTSTEEIGIRKPVALEKIEEFYEFMSNGTVDVTMNWKGRHKEHVSLMKSGELWDVAFVMKRLFYLSLIKPLSFREKKMMEKAKELITSEISEVSDTPEKEIEIKVLESLSFCFREIEPSFES